MSKEKNKTKNHKSHFDKGITLIALIITIIVMLILVIVTLTIALGENGVITKTIEAKKEQDLAAFKECVEIAAAGAFKKDEITGDYTYNWDDFKTEVTTANNGEYSNATFIYLILGISPVQGNLENENIGMAIKGSRKIIEYIDSNGLSGEITNATHKSNITNIANEHGIEITNWRAGSIKAGCNLNISFYSTLTILVECDGMQTSVGVVKCAYQDYMIVMKRSEADKLFEFTEKYYDEDDYSGYVTTIASYKQNAKHVDVPGLIIEDDGSYTYVIGIEANAFEKGGIKYPAIYIVGMEESATYNSTSTIAEFKAELTSAFSSSTDDLSLQALSIIENYNCPEGDTCTKISCKNVVFKELLILAGQANGFGIQASNADDYITYDEEGKMYILMNSNYQPVTSAQWVESKTESIKVSELISEIGSQAFKNCTNLKTIYIPESVFIGSNICDLASDAFEGCTSLTEITTPSQSLVESSRNFGCPNTITKKYVDITAGLGS